MTLDPTLPEDRWVQVNGLNLHYLDWGGDRTKKTLILMHGIGGHAHQFDDFAPLWAETHHVLALDARGCGDSDWAKEGYSVQSFAADVAGLARKLGLYPFDYYGYSQGSRIGFALGAYYGDLVDHLVLGDFGPEPDPSPAGRETGRRRMQGQAPAAQGLLQRPAGLRLAPAAGPRRLRRPGVEGGEVRLSAQLGRHPRAQDGPGDRLADGAHGPQRGAVSLGLRASGYPAQPWCCGGRRARSWTGPRRRRWRPLIPGGKGRFGEVPGVGHGLHSEDLQATAGVIREFLAE